MLLKLYKNPLKRDIDEVDEKVKQLFFFLFLEI